MSKTTATGAVVVDDYHECPESARQIEALAAEFESFSGAAPPPRHRNSP
jgi:hypothetical protein